MFRPTGLFRLVRCAAAGTDRRTQVGTPVPVRATGVPVPPKPGRSLVRTCGHLLRQGPRDHRPVQERQSCGGVVSRVPRCGVLGLAALTPDIGPNTLLAIPFERPSRGGSGSRLAACSGASTLAGGVLADLHLRHWSTPTVVAAGRGSRSRFPTGRSNSRTCGAGCRGVDRNSQESHRTSTGSPQAVHRICRAGAHRPRRARAAAASLSSLGRPAGGWPPPGGPGPGARSPGPPGGVRRRARPP